MSKEFWSQTSLLYQQVQDENVLISYICTHYKCRNETSAWRHALGITQIAVNQEMRSEDECETST